MDYSEDTIEWQVIGSTQQENSFNYSEQLNEILKKLNIKRLDHSQFRQRDYLGRGAYAEVYSGLYQEKEYAFKCLKDKLRLEDKKVKKFFKYMSRELELLSEVNHPNVVEFYGILQNELKILSEETIEFFTNDFNNGAEVQRDESDEFSEQFSELFLSELDRPNDVIAIYHQ
ncbi:14955_t:CDS:2, partial [Gigaspora rosea]